MIIRDNLGRPLNLSTRGLSEPKSANTMPAYVPLVELRRALKAGFGTIRITFFGHDTGMFVSFRPPVKKTSVTAARIWETGRIGCRTIPTTEWKKMVAFVKTTKKAKAAKVGA